MDGICIGISCCALDNIGGACSTTGGATVSTCSGAAIDDDGRGCRGTARGVLGGTGMLGIMVVAAGAGAMFAVGVEWATGIGACAGDAAEADTVDDEEGAAIAAAAAATAAATGFW